MFASIVTIFGGIAAVFGIFKLGVWLVRKTPEQKKEAIDQDVANDENTTTTTGRP